MSKLASALLFVVGLSLVESYTRHDFPAASRFVFGAGTSSYQVEGAAHEDGRTPSIFDTYAHSGTSGANGDVACDQYHKYKEDVQLMVDSGLEAYRFSISWSRLIPNGRGPVNPKGLQYYNNLINELINHGIQPHVTLHHVDLPQALEDEYGGWISRKVVQDFTTFADVCFRMFGDRVRHWTTFNEANVFVLGGYDVGFIPPQRCSSPFGFVTCAKGNSTIEPYLAAHYILISHASAARLYKQKYQEKQKGYVGFNLYTYYFYPFTNTTEDILATQRANDFYLGWFANPLVYGDYPETVKNSARSRIPSFTALESEQIKGSVDFFGINFYYVRQVKNSPTSLNEKSRDFLADMEIEFKSVTTNNQQGYSEFPVTPWGLQGVLEYFKRTYGNPPIYIHETGLMMRRNTTLEDWPRVRALQAYIGAALDSLRNGSNMRGYFTWSFLDLYEIFDGYNSGYGLYYVDLDDPDLKRYPKLSSHWYSHFLKGGNSNSFIMNSSSVSSS